MELSSLLLVSSAEHAYKESVSAVDPSLLSMQILQSHGCATQGNPFQRIRCLSWPRQEDPSLRSKWSSVYSKQIWQYPISNKTHGLCSRECLRPSGLFRILEVRIWLSILSRLSREPSDLDIILNAPPHLLTESIQRNMLRNQINQARATGQSTELLEAELAYIDVRKEAMKAKNAAQSKAWLIIVRARK